MNKIDDISLNDINKYDLNNELIEELNHNNDNDTLEKTNNKKRPIQFKNNIDLLTFEYFSKQNSYNKFLKTVNKENDTNLINKHDKKFYKKRIINETKKMIKNEFENEILKDSFNRYIFSLVNYFKFQDKIDILQEEYKELNIDRSIYPINEVNTELYDDITNDTYTFDDINIDNMDYNNNSVNELLYNFNKKEFNKMVTLDNFIIKENKETNKDKSRIIPLQKNIDLREPSLKTKGLKLKNNKKEITTNNIETNEDKKEQEISTSIKNKEI